MAKRLAQRPNDDGGYYLESMTDAEHEAHEAELARPDFVHAHGLAADLFNQTWQRQAGLCAVCARPLDIRVSFYEEDGGAAIVCAVDSNVLTIRSDSARFGIESPV